MQKFQMSFFADSAGMYYYNLCLRALHDPKVAEYYEYAVEYNLPTAEHSSGLFHRVTWWRKQEKGVQR